MTPRECLQEAINPALYLLPLKMTSAKARVALLATGLQESGLTFRVQKTHDPYTPGPAKGLWQNERGTVQLVMTNVVTEEHARALCIARKVPFDAALVHARLEFDDILAAGFARLIFWADPRPLPPLGDPVGMWKTYLHCWRPGVRRPEDWPANYDAALQEVVQ